MIVKDMTAEQEVWLDKQIAPSPDVFILAYAGTSYKEWKLVAMMLAEDFLKLGPEQIEQMARTSYPSAQAYKVYKVAKPKE